MSLLDTHADRLDWQEDGTAIFTLLKPLKTSSGEVSTLIAKRPLLEDLLANEKASGDDMLKMAMVVARLTGLKLAEIDEIPGGDSMVLAEVMTRMLEYGEKGSLLDRHADRLTITDFDASLKLLRPINTPQGESDEIVVRHPTLKETRTNQGSTLSAAVKLLAILTGIGPLMLGKLDALDGMILSELVSDFLGKPRQQPSGGR
jgi:hypothetical protein